MPEYWDGEIPWCTPTDITATRGRNLSTTARRITAKGLDSCGASLLPTGALLLCSRATIGEVRIASMSVATNQGFKSLVCGESVNHEYLYYCLVTLKEKMVDLASGSTFLEITTRDVANIRLSLPPLHEQRAIATVLTDVDALIGSLEALVAKKQAIKRAAMQQLLTGRMRLPGFSGEWEKRRLGEIAAITMGQSPPSASYNTIGDGLPLIQGKADIIGRATIHRTWTSEPSKRCAAGDIVLTVRAPVGAVAMAKKDVSLGRGVCGLKPLIDRQFLFCALIALESKWDSVGQGSTFSAADSSQVAGFLIAAPSDRSEQTAIASVLSDMDVEIAALERRLDKTRALKQGMMQQLLTGSIRLSIPDAVAECGPGQ